MTTRARLILGVALAALFLAAAVPAFASKGNGGSGGGGSTGSGGSITLAPLYTHSGAPVLGDLVTFSVATSGSFPYVRVSCYQRSLVYSQTNGFFPGYPWGQTYQLGPTPSWTSGSASCTAVLFTTSGRKTIVLGSTTFP